MPKYGARGQWIILFPIIRMKIRETKLLYCSRYTNACMPKFGFFVGDQFVECCSRVKSQGSSDSTSVPSFPLSSFELEHGKEMPMSNPSLAEPESRNANPTDHSSFGKWDDDDDDADLDDDEGMLLPRNECWLSHSGFGSPEWWSRT
jgi:hypothetical protein